VRWLFACFLLTSKKLPELSNRRGFFFDKLFAMTEIWKKKTNISDFLVYASLGMYLVDRLLMRQQV